MSNPNQAGKGDSPRSVNMTVFGERYDAIFRKKSAPAKSSPQELNDPLESPDHDNDDGTYAEQIGYP